MSEGIETGLYPLDRIDEAAAELKASVASAGLKVYRMGWVIVDGDQRFAPGDTLGCDIDRVVAHAKCESAMSRDARFAGQRHSDAAQIKLRAAGSVKPRTALVPKSFVRVEDERLRGIEEGAAVVMTGRCVETPQPDGLPIAYFEVSIDVSSVTSSRLGSKLPTSADPSPKS